LLTQRVNIEHEQQILERLGLTLHQSRNRLQVELRSAPPSSLTVDEYELRSSLEDRDWNLHAVLSDGFLKLLELALSKC
jgi:hypothetical protein